MRSGSSRPTSSATRRAVTSTCCMACSSGRSRGPRGAPDLLGAPHGYVRRRGQRVAAADRVAELGEALVPLAEIPSLELRGFVRELLVFDVLAEPLRVVALVQMELPGLGVDTFGELEKLNEILRPQVELLVATAEIEAALGR